MKRGTVNSRRFPPAKGDAEEASLVGDIMAAVPPVLANNPRYRAFLERQPAVRLRGIRDRTVIYFDLMQRKTLWAA